MSTVAPWETEASTVVAPWESADTQAPWEATPALPSPPSTSPKPGQSVREYLLEVGQKAPAFSPQAQPINTGVSALTGQPAEPGGFVEPSRTGTTGSPVNFDIIPEVEEPPVDQNASQFLKTGVKLATGYEHGMARFVNSMLHPENIAMMVGLAGAPAIVGKAASLGFGAEAAKSVYDQSKELVNETDPTKKAAAITSILLNTAMGAGMLAHGFSREPIVSPETEAVAQHVEQAGLPQTADALRESVSAPGTAPTLPIGKSEGKAVAETPVAAPQEAPATTEQPTPEAQPQPATEAAAPNLASARESAFNQAHPETDITPDSAHLAAAIADVQENHGTQFYKGGEPTAYVVRSMEEGRLSWKLVEPTAEAVRGRDGKLHAPEIGFDTSEEAVASGLKRGFEVDPNALSDYEKTRGQTASGLPEQPPREGETQPSQEQGASVQASQTGGAGQTRVRIAIPDSPTGVPDLIDFVKEQGGIKLPRKGARTQEHDDVTDEIEGFYKGKLANPKGAIHADEMAQMAYDSGLIKDPSVSAFWRALHDNIVQRPKTREMARVMQRKMVEAEKQDRKKSEVPTLRQGENQGDLLSKQQEDLTLVGEKGTDFAKREAERLAAEKAAQEAKDLQEKQQSKLFDDHAAGVQPAAKVIADSVDQKEAAQVTPQALGIRAPLPAFLRDAIDYFTTNSPSQIWNSVKGSLDATIGKTFAKTTIADRSAGELGARWISSRIAAPHLAQTFVANVLENTGVDPVKFGAALTEDNLRSVKKGFLDAGDTTSANNVVSIIGAKDSPFKTEADYQAFFADPNTQTAIQRHQSLWDTAINPMYRKAQLLDPAEPLATRGEQTDARINLYNDAEAKGKNVVSGTGTGNLTATTRKKSPFAIQAKGTGQSYNVNYDDMMANTFGRQLEIASKNTFEQQLVDSGNAIIGKPAKDVTLPDGEATVAFPLKRTVLIYTADGSKIPVNQNIFVRKSLAGEYRRGADVDLIKVPSALRAFNTVVNRTALAGLTDASVHVLNLGTALLTRPSVASGVLRDSLLSAFGRADVPVIAIKALTKGFQDNRAQLSELAEIGALRAEHPTINPMGKVIAWADKTSRLVLDDAFKKMADAGLVQATETNRREFVNQIGQYNKRAQGDLRRLARDSGFGPFATAGTTFNTLGLRTMAMSPGVKATGTMAAASLRANVMAKWVGAFALTGTLNYLLTGKVAGRPGVPMGKIDTGLDDANKRPLSLPLFDLLGLGRALRVTGVRGFVEAKRKGLTTQNALDAASTDLWNTNISPFTGPAIRFAGVASSGRQIPSVNVPRTSRVVPPGESQWRENVKQAIIDANPIIKSIALSREPGQGIGAAIRQQIPRISLQPSQSAEFMSKYPEIVRKAQAREYINDVIGRARKMSPVEQRAFVRESLGKLTPEDQQHAARTLDYSRILH